MINGDERFDSLVVKPQEIRGGDKIMHRVFGTTRLEYIGTACGASHCCSLDAEQYLWKVYLRAGRIKRFFMRKMDDISVLRPLLT